MSANIQKMTKSYCSFCRYYKAQQKIRVDRTELKIIDDLKEAKYLWGDSEGELENGTHPIRILVKNHACHWYFADKSYDDFLKPRKIKIYDAAYDKNIDNVCPHFKPNVKYFVYIITDELWHIINHH